MNALAWRMLARDWRAGELKILALALVVAVASVTSVGFFADRVRQSLARDAHQLLGADLVLTADHPWPAPLRDEIRRRGLRLAENTNFVSMAIAGEQAQLVSIKAVSAGYPLRGRLRTAPALNTPDSPTDAIPEAGTVWIDERLSAMLGRAVGDTIELGRSHFRVGAILTLEPDRGVTFFNVAPRLMMNLADLPATALVQNGSRVWYYLLLAGEREAIEAFESWFKPRIGRGESVQGLNSARPEIRASLDRAEKFIGLTALLAVILAAVAVSLATRRYTQRHLDGYAVMRCFGALQSRLFGLFAREFGLLGAIAAAAGCLLGYAAQFVIAIFIGELIGAQLPQPSPIPAAQGFLIGLALLLGFALPPLMQLKNVPALRVIRREVGAPGDSAIAGYATGLACIGALLVWQAGEAKLGLVVLGGFVGAFVAFGLIALGLLQLLGRFAGSGSISWRYGLASLRRRARASSVQILALALGLTAILLLTFTRNDLLASWRGKIPADAPNRFIVNIQPEQRAPVLEAFRAAGLPSPDAYPMIRGRYVALNGAPVDADAYDERLRRMVEREFNLSYMEALPEHNAIVSGRWFGREDASGGALSVEEGIAKSLGWKIGDRLSWQVAGQTFTAPIVNVRSLDWDSMRVNFFVIGTPGLLSSAPTSYISAFHLPADRAAFGSSLVQRFPNLTLVDTSAILRQAQTIMDQVVRAVQFVFLFALGAGVLVLYSALLATQDERMQEAAVMRALGASRAQILSAQRAEFAALGLIAGALAAAGATAIGWAISRFVFQFSYQVDHWVWVAGPLLGLACIALNAVAGGRAALKHPPILALRET